MLTRLRYNNPGQKPGLLFETMQAFIITFNLFAGK